MRKQGPQPSHTALSTKRLEVLTLMLSLLNTTQTNGFHSLHLFCSVALITSILTCLPKLFPFLSVCLSSPTPAPALPLLWLSVILCPDHFLQQKMANAFLPPSYLEIPFVSCYIPFSWLEHSQTPVIHHFLAMLRCVLHQAP